MSKLIGGWVLLTLLVCGKICGGESTCAFVNALNAGKKQTLVVYGTSLTAGGAWVKQLQALFDEKYPGLLTISNGAQSGMNSSWGMQNVQARVIDKKPDAVLIEFGMNDAVQRFNLSKEECHANMTKILDDVKTSLPNCELILMTMNSASGENGAKRGGHLAEYYQIYRDIAAERKLLLIDHS